MDTPATEGAHREAGSSPLAFLACVVGAIYSAMMLGCSVHELLGHGLAAVALGGTLHEFMVDPAAHGFARYTGVPDGVAWLPLWAGIGVNLLFGAVAVLLSRLPALRSGHAGLAVLAVGTTHGGQALGYALQGALSGHGDARSLHTDLDGALRAVVVAAIVALYALLLDWGMRRLAHLIAEQVPVSDARTRRRWFLGTVLLPFAALAALRPASTIFSPAIDWGSRAALVLVVGAWGWWRCGGLVAEDIRHRPLGRRGAIAWLLVAGALGTAAAAWSKDGVELAAAAPVLVAVPRIGPAAARGRERTRRFLPPRGKTRMVAT